jgi:apolipoprotein N-acyltransferase
LLVDPSGRPVASYDKIHLVPIGEFVPFRRILPFRREIEELVYRVAGWYPSLTPGESSPVLPLEIEGRRIPFGVMICYDSVFPGVARRAAREGARFLVNLSNDGWYGRSAELDQILAITRFRAVESRLPVFRVTNSGISAVIDSRGRMVETLVGEGRDGERRRKEAAGFLVRSIGLGAGDAPYVVVGDAFAVLCAILAVTALPRRRRST